MAKNDTSSQMRKLVKQFKDSGQSQKEFAAVSSTPKTKLFKILKND
jgi:predicted transcriptional regulator